VTHEVRVLEPAELRAAHTLFYGALHFGPVDDEGWARAETGYAPGRTLGVSEGSSLVGTVSSWDTLMAVPGGAALPAACVSKVGVRPDHTRRGLLSAMMRAQLQDIAARGEVLASLRATEATIYGRFGYGVATRTHEVRVRRSRGWRPGAPVGGRVRLLERADIVSTLAPLHERLALRRPGGITRRAPWWTLAVERRLAAQDHALAAVHTGADGDDGYAIAFLRANDDDFTARTLVIEDMHAADVDATAGLWRFLLTVDLIGSIEAAQRPIDEPLDLLLADPRDRVVKGVDDEAWLRIVDVPAALAARAYDEGDPVLLAVHDAILEKNAGVYRVGAEGAERVGPIDGPVAAELECDVVALAMAYLGDRAPSELATTGWWRASTPEAVRRADRLFATDTVPWCGTFF
jgi:predicted acetyltransferase